MLGAPPKIAILPPDLQQAIDQEIESGERIVWLQQPQPRAFGRQGYVSMVMGIPFTAFSIFWIVMANRMTSSGGSHDKFFALFGIPFLLMGLGMLTSPWWMRLRARRTVYVITDRRAITRTTKSFGRSEVQSFYPDRLTSMKRKERGDSSGDLIFEEFTTPAGSGTMTVRRGFMGIERVRDAEEFIRKTLLANRVREIDHLIRDAYHASTED